jgi:PEP-CTERM motif
VKILVTLVVGLAIFSVNSYSTPVTFTYTGSASGTVGSMSFSNAAFTISAVGDTANRQTFNTNGFTGFFIDHSSVTISIAGIGVLQVTTGTRTFVNNSISMIGLSRAGINGSDLYDFAQVPGASTWDMLSPFALYTGVASVLQWNFQPNINTNLGVLLFNDGPVIGTFRADFRHDRCIHDCIVTTVNSQLGPLPTPEPSALLLVGLGIAGLFVVRRS